MSAPLILFHAKLWPSPQPGADALLLAGGRIVAAGPAQAMFSIAPAAPRVDAGGASVTPGLCDAHVHFVPWAQSRMQVDLAGIRTRAGALERIAAALAADPSNAPLVGRGWDEAGWEQPIAREPLDRLAPGRPVLLHRHDFHALWVNSAALRAAGITRSTRDPEGGRFARDGAGEPSGLVQENAVSAFAALEDLAGPRVTDGLLDEAATVLHAAGITAVHDFQRNAADFRRMRGVASRRRLRVLQNVGAGQMDALAAAGAASGIGDAWFRIGALKLFADGTLGSRTAAMLEPFADRGGLGMEMMSAAELRETVARATQAGFACAIHAIGDRAVRNSLDALEAAGDERRALGLPSRIEHVQRAAAADLARFAPLGVAASVQPQHAVTDAEVALAAWGPERCRSAYAYRTLLDSGTVLAFGSDAPVEVPRAALGLQAAVTRSRPDSRPAGGFVPDQRLTLAQALHAYTAGAAALAGLTGVLGSLAPGAEADVVVWDRDLFAAPEGDLAAAAARVSVLGGEIVYLSPGARPEAVAAADSPGAGPTT